MTQLPGLSVAERDLVIITVGRVARGVMTAPLMVL